jgi:hypothetical protein
LSTAKHQSYIEIQGGPIGDQSIKLDLKPKETHLHVEYWIPTDRVLDIYSLKVPEVQLRSTSQIPLFDWARPGEICIWQDLLRAYESKGKLPQPPEMYQNLWTPSGMENIELAFNWTIDQTHGRTANLWKFYYGTWLAGRNELDSAIKWLSSSNIGVAKVLLARLLKVKGDILGARKSFESIEERWLQLHPQVIIERDKVLRHLGVETIPEREKWLSQVNALKDEWIMERKVQLLIDKEDIQNARELLLSVPFQKVHQTYTRTGLWRQICEKLKVSYLPIPASLGEDCLAVFGAYREYE